jgi:hypothetical protein
VRRLAAVLAAASAAAGLAAPAALATPDVTLLATIGRADDAAGPRPGPAPLHLHVGIPEAPQPSPWTTLTLTLDPAIALAAQAVGTAVGDSTAHLEIGSTGFATPEAGEACTGGGPVTQEAAGAYGIHFRTTTVSGCPVRLDYTLPGTVTAAAAAGTTLTVTTPDALRHPVAGLDLVFTAFDLSLSVGPALTACSAGEKLAFTATLQHEDGFSSASTAYAPCRPALQPLHVRPSFTLHAARRGAMDRGTLGELVALRAAPGLQAGVVQLRCDAGCPKRELASRAVRGDERAPLLKLRRPLRITAGTRISVHVTDLDGQRGTYAYRFARTKAGLVARAVR